MRWTNARLTPPRRTLGGIYGALTIKELREQMESLRQSGSEKALKQQFTQWFNGRHGRKGTLWEERYKSVLVEGAGEALATMSAYIDLNPVRAGLVDDPREYRWCGYAAGIGDGHRGAQPTWREHAPGAGRVSDADLRARRAKRQR